LLDPTDADDVSLIAFDEEGKAVAAPNSSPWEEMRVKETVKRSKLNEHEPLIEECRKVWQRASFEYDQYKAAKARCVAGTNLAARQKAVDHLQNILNMTRKQAELSFVAVWCVLFKNDPKPARLVA
jgi:hypothetical protein